MSLTVSSTESNLSHNKDNEWDELLEGLTLIPYHERVTRFIRGSTIHWFAGRVTVVDSRPLYTATVHHLQRRLAEETRRLRRMSWISSWMASEKPSYTVGPWFKITI